MDSGCSRGRHLRNRKVGQRPYDAGSYAIAVRQFFSEVFHDHVDIRLHERSQLEYVENQLVGSWTREILFCKESRFVSRKRLTSFF